MDKFPRELQNEILTILHDNFPYGFTKQQKQYLCKFYNSETLSNNLAYLHMHGLVKCEFVEKVNLPKYAVVILSNVQITQEGIDFIRGDGGLSSILKVKTIKIHEETVNQLAVLLQSLNQK